MGHQHVSAMRCVRECVDRGCRDLGRQQVQLTNNLMSGPLNGGGLLSRVWVTIYNLWLLFPRLGALGWELGLSHPSSGSMS